MKKILLGLLLSLSLSAGDYTNSTSFEEIKKDPSEISLFFNPNSKTCTPFNSFMKELTGKDFSSTNEAIDKLAFLCSKLNEDTPCSAEKAKPNSIPYIILGAQKANVYFFFTKDVESCELLKLSAP